MSYRPSTRCPVARRNSPLKRWGRVLVVLTLGFTLSACGMVKATKSLFGGNYPLEVWISEDLNQNSPIAVEVVIVYDKSTLDKLVEMSARDWFAKRDQLAKDLADKVDLWPFEWVPRDDLETPLDYPLELNLPYRIGANGRVVFADYYSPGQHRLVVDPYKPLRLRFEEGGFRSEPLR